jgi:hypothetical protein
VSYEVRSKSQHAGQRAHTQDEILQALRQRRVIMG